MTRSATMQPEQAERVMHESGVLVMHESEIPFSRLTPLPDEPTLPPARSKGEIIVLLLRHLRAERRKTATWQDLTQQTLNLLGEVSRDRDRLRERYHALLNERRRERTKAAA